MRIWLGSLACTLLLALPTAARVQLPPQQTSVVGGSGGTAFSRDCGGGKVLTGLRGREGLQIDAIGIMCAPVLANGGLGPTSAVGTLPGGGGGTFKELRCASGSVVTAIFVNYGTVANQVTIYCRAWDAATRRFTGSASPGAELGALRTQDREIMLSCEAKTQPGAGIRGRSGLIVDAIGLICDEP